MSRKSGLLALQLIVALALLISLECAVMAQESRPARIGFLGAGKPNALNLEGFHMGMRDRGHVEGKSYVLVPGWATKPVKRTARAALLQSLLAKNVDVIVTLSSWSTRLTMRTAPTVPVVMAESAAPVRAGLIKTLAKPGGNVTGVSSAAVDAGIKGIEVLTQLLPGLRRVGAIHRGSDQYTGVSKKMWEPGNKRAAEILGVEVTRFGFETSGSFDTLMARVKAWGAGAISIRSTNSLTTAARQRLIDAALDAGIASISSRKEMVKQGALASLGPNYPWIYRRVAAYVDLILKGAKPADLPVEVANRLDLAFNLTTARKLGIKVPLGLLLRADEVIE